MSPIDQSGGGCVIVAELVVIVVRDLCFLDLCECILIKDVFHTKSTVL